MTNCESNTGGKQLHLKIRQNAHPGWESNLEAYRKELEARAAAEKTLAEIDDRLEWLRSWLSDAGVELVVPWVTERPRQSVALRGMRIHRSTAERLSAVLTHITDVGLPCEIPLRELAVKTGIAGETLRRVIVPWLEEAGYVAKLGKFWFKGYGGKKIWGLLIRERYE